MLPVNNRNSHQGQLFLLRAMHLLLEYHTVINQCVFYHTISFIAKQTRLVNNHVFPTFVFHRYLKFSHFPILPVPCVVSNRHALQLSYFRQCFPSSL